MQSERLRKNLDTETPLANRIEDAMAFMNSVKVGMMCTRNGRSQLVSRAMALAATSQGVDLLFHTNTETGKTDELAQEPHVNIAFYQPSSGEWASVSGTARISTDRELVHKHYNVALRTWMGDLGDGKHDGGKDDPVCCVFMRELTQANWRDCGAHRDHFACSQRAYAGE